MYSKILFFKFKGMRTYVQGGDIFNAVNEHLVRFGSYLTAIVFKSFTKHHLRYSESLDADGKLIAQGKAVDKNGQFLTFYLYETDVPVDQRYDFVEDKITLNAKLDGLKITLAEQNEFTVIENIIAITKNLSYALHPLETGKWVFGQLLLKMRLPTSYKSIQIIQKSIVQNNFSTNAIYIDNEPIGEIKFIVANP